jgi:hypothetical protein
MSIAKMQMNDLDLFHFSKLCRIHDHLILDGEIDLPPDPCIHKNGTASCGQILP